MIPEAELRDLALAFEGSDSDEAKERTRTRQLEVLLSKDCAAA